MSCLGQWGGGKVRTYRHEDLTTVREVQSAENQAGLALLIALGPGLAEKIPFRLELSAKLAAEARLESRQEDGNGVVAGGGGQGLVAGVGELDRRGGEGLGMEFVEALLGGLLSSERTGRQERGRGQEGLEEAHGEFRCGPRSYCRFRERSRGKFVFVSWPIGLGDVVESAYVASGCAASVVEMRQADAA